MNDWTANDAKEFLDIIRSEAEKAVKNYANKQSSVFACLAIVTDIAESGAITVRLLSSPSDGSQDFVVRNRSGSTLELGDSVWLHYWSDYTNVYIAVRNMGDTEADITATGIGALSYTEAQSLSAAQKAQVLANAGAAPVIHASQHAIGGSDSLNALPYNAVSSNLLINGGFDVWQRGVSFSSSGGYTADRWKIDFDGTGATRAITRQAFTVGQTDVPNNPTYYLRYAQSVAGSGGTYSLVTQLLEDVSRLSGKTVTISFYAKADSARDIVTQFDQYFGSGGSSPVYVGEATHSLTTSWRLFTCTVTFPSISGKTVGASNFSSIYFSLPINTTFIIDIANVQLNYGSVALPFVPRSFADELRLCQRYYQILPSFWSTTVPSTGVVEIGNAVFPVAMRVAPNVVINSQPNATGADGYVDCYGVGSVSLSGATIGAIASALLSITKTGAFVTTALYRGSAKLDSEL